MTEIPAKREIECNEDDFWLDDNLQAVLANLEDIKATVREKESEDSDAYKKCLQREERYRSLLANIP